MFVFFQDETVTDVTWILAKNSSKIVYLDVCTVTFICPDDMVTIVTWMFVMLLGF